MTITRSKAQCTLGAIHLNREKGVRHLLELIDVEHEYTCPSASKSVCPTVVGYTGGDSEAKMEQISQTVRAKKT